MVECGSAIVLGYKAYMVLVSSLFSSYSSLVLKSIEKDMFESQLF